MGRWLPDDYGSTHKVVIEKFLKISNKSGATVPFVLNHAQQEVLTKLTGRDVIPKPRQEGISSLFLACFFLDCLAYENLRCVVIAHDSDSTERLFQRVHFFLNNFQGGKIETETSTKREIRFVNTNSTFYVETAGTKTAGRSGTINRLLCSEVAFWPDPKTLTAGLLQSVPQENSMIVFESTGNGAETWYHRRAIAALNPRNEYGLHFLSWQDFPEYTDEWPQAETYQLDPLYEEEQVFNDHNLTPGQMSWRRRKIDDMDGDLALFRQEYPLTLDECFQTRGQSFFHRVQYEDIGDRWQPHTDSSYFTYDTEHPRPQHHYGIGVDVGGGVGGDSSVVEVFSLEDYRQVGEYVNNNISPDEFSRILSWIGEFFNYAPINLETNNHGILTLYQLLEEYPIENIYRDERFTQTTYDRGTQTTRRSKPIIIGNLRRALAGGLTVVSPYLRGELSSFIEKATSDVTTKLEARDGAHDDSVIAAALANEVLLRHAEQIAYDVDRPQVINPEADFTFRAILANYNQSKFPIGHNLLPR